MLYIRDVKPEDFLNYRNIILVYPCCTPSFTRLEVSKINRSKIPIVISIARSGLEYSFHFFIQDLKDIQAGLAPLSENEALNMIRNLKSYKIIQGIRGQEAVNECKFAETIARVSVLVKIAPEILSLIFIIRLNSLTTVSSSRTFRVTPPTSDLCTGPTTFMTNGKPMARADATHASWVSVILSFALWIPAASNN